MGMGLDGIGPDLSGGITPEFLAHLMLLRQRQLVAPQAAPARPQPAPQPVTATGQGDPYNPYNGQPGGPPQGVSVDPRFIAQMAQQAQAAMGGGVPPAAPDFAPVVANQQTYAHPHLAGLAQALQGALQAYNASGHARQDTGLAAGLNFAAGLTRPFGQQAAKVDAQNEANQKLASDQNKLNWLASQEAAKEKRAQAGRIELANVKPSRFNAPVTVAPSDAELIRGAVSAKIITPEAGKVLALGMTQEQRDGLIMKGVPGGQNAQPADDYKGIAEDIVSGNAPAYPGYYTRGTWNHVASELHKMKDENGKPINTTKLILDYTGARQLASTMNQNQFVSYQTALTKAVPTLDYVETLANKLQSQIPQGRVKVLNGLAIKAAANGAFGPDAADTATQLLGQISGPLIGDMAQVYSKGGVPTDEARAQVRTQVNPDMGRSIQAAISGMRRDINFAATAVTEVQPFRLQGAGGAGYGQTDQPPIIPPAGGGGGIVKMKSPSGKTYQFDAAHAAEARAHGYVDVP